MNIAGKDPMAILDETIEQIHKDLARYRKNFETDSEEAIQRAKDGFRAAIEIAPEIPDLMSRARAIYIKEIRYDGCAFRDPSVGLMVGGYQYELNRGGYGDEPIGAPVVDRGGRYRVVVALIPIEP